MKNFIILLLCFGFEFQAAFASFPCCRWIFHSNSGQWELQELCEGMSCEGLPKPRTLTDSANIDVCPEAPQGTVFEPDRKCNGKPINSRCTAFGLNGQSYPGRCYFVPSFSDYCFCAEE